jgi:hypothetical protein
VIVSYSIELSVDCRACNVSVPVNGVVPVVRCYHCGEDNRLEDRWPKIVDRELLAEVWRWDEGRVEPKRVVFLGGEPAYRLGFGKRLPRCEACQGPPLDLAALLTDPDGECFCPGCGQSVRVRAAEPLSRGLEPCAWALVGETALDAEARAVQARDRPVLFACMGCGAGLKVDGSSRSVTCGHCDAANYLPDGLWHQVNPVPRPRPFFLVCDYDYASARALRWTDEDVRVGDASSPSLDVAEIELLAKDESKRVRRQVARNPNAWAELLDLLVVDPEPDVRDPALQHPNTSELTLLAACHQGPWYIQRVLARDALPASVLDFIAGDPSTSFREKVAGRQDTPVSTLKRLAEDADDGVRRIARSSLEILRAAGVDVGPAPGFFAKLLGD